MAVWWRALLMVVVLVLGAAGAAPAAEPTADMLSAAAAKGECLASRDVMRRTHMDMLRHQRDQVVRLGLRRSGAGLGECVACHAVAGDDGRAVAVSDDRHFCAGCHRSAAVSVDCFGCHRSTPDDRTAGGRP